MGGLVQPVLDEGAQCTRLLAVERLHGLQVGPDRGHARRVRFEVLLLAGDDEAALPRLDIFQVRQEALGGDNDGVVVPHGRIDVPIAPVGPDRTRQRCEEDDRREP